MSVTGTGSFGNNDLTAQVAGAPSATQTTHAGETRVAAAVDENVNRTRDNSTTEVASDTAGEETENVEDAIELERRHSIVQSLAKQYSRRSHANGEAGSNPFAIASEDKDSPLNPNGPNFSARAWAKAVVNLAAGEGHKWRTSGVAFQNLNVHGFGSPTDYQKDVVNVWLEAVGLVRKLTGHGKRRIDILRDFDGLVRSGEMLVVLGPPGSGCSTFLKTIAGDYNGIFIDDKSYFNYQGTATACSLIWCPDC
jgi:ABC-type glutathione transport system ATPase component